MVSGKLMLEELTKLSSKNTKAKELADKVAKQKEEAAICI